MPPFQTGRFDDDLRAQLDETNTGKRQRVSDPYQHVAIEPDSIPCDEHRHLPATDRGDQDIVRLFDPPPRSDREPAIL